MYAKYKAYITSIEWYTMKLDIIQLKGCKCEKCLEKKQPNKLQLHHITYDNLYYESLKDLMLLCETCHMKEHGIIKEKRIIKPKKNKSKLLLSEYNNKIKQNSINYQSGLYPKHIYMQKYKAIHKWYKKKKLLTYQC